MRRSSKLLLICIMFGAGQVVILALLATVAIEPAQIVFNDGVQRLFEIYEQRENELVDCHNPRVPVEVCLNVVGPVLKQLSHFFTGIKTLNQRVAEFYSQPSFECETFGIPAKYCSNAVELVKSMAGSLTGIPSLHDTTSHEASEAELIKLYDGMNRLVSFYNTRMLNCEDHSVPSEVCMNVTELIEHMGYPCEDHTAQTEDGFLLSIQHIPHGRNNSHVVHNTNRPVVFVQHGLLSSSADWVVNLANQSLGTVLADAGFDVWLGNVRGNTYSKKHIHLKPSQSEFWAWSWDEMAEYDLPAMVDYVLKQTGQSQLYYIGHSQGTMIAFAEMSKPNNTLTKKIKSMYALGPVTTVGHIKGVLRYLSYFTKDIEALFNIFGINDFMPSNELLKFLAATFCNLPSRIMCEDIVFMIAGFDSQQFNQTRMPVYISHTPAGTSTQNIVHFAQMVRSDKFQMYDYGSRRHNEKHYNQSTPPLYYAENVEAPVHLFSAGKDWLADPEDVAGLAKKLPNLVHHDIYPEWNHLDFLWAMDAATRCYKTVIDRINQDHASHHH